MTGFPIQTARGSSLMPRFEHAIVADRLSPWGLVSDFDVLRAAEAGAEDLTAGEVSRSAAVMIAPTDTLTHAAELMREHGTGHLVVVAPDGATPVGVVSTLDVAGVIAWGEA